MVNVYLVCDNCGYIHSPADRPCLNCGVERAWEFRLLNRALTHSRMIKDRVVIAANDRAETPHRDPHG